MTRQHPFEIRLAESWAPEAWKDVTILLAVSGGADSVALLRCLHAISLPGASQANRRIVAHFDHRLRPDSDVDARFVAQLAEQLGWEHCSETAPTATISQGDGIEAAARAARYDFLRRAALDFGARYVVTAHTADDQVETVLHRLLRGTGLHGAAGIARARELHPGVSLLRPMLTISRREVLSYLADCGQSFREDPSNQEDRFQRNRIRHQLRPLIRELEPGAEPSVLRFAQLARDASEVLDELALAAAERCCRQDGKQLVVDPSELAQLKPFLACLMLQQQWRKLGWPERDMGREKWERLRLALIDPNAAEELCFPGGVRVEAQAAPRVRLVRT